MKPAPFSYHDPESVEEVVSLLSSLEDARVIAGGQSLVPMMALRLTSLRHLVDLRHVGGLTEVRSEGDRVHLGAMVRQARFESDETSRRLAPCMAAATPFIGHFQIRNRGTVGGSIAHADPAAEYPAVALALDAHLRAAGPSGEREIPAVAFFEGVWSTALGSDEVLTGMSFRPWGERSAFAVDEVARRHGDFALAGAVCGVELGEQDHITQVSVALFGVTGTPVRASATEASLIGGALHHEAIETAAALAMEGLEPTTDIHASGAHRARLVPVVVARALRTIKNELEGGFHS